MPKLPANSAQPSAATPEQPRPLLALREAVTLIVGIVVGAGIFKAPAPAPPRCSWPGCWAAPSRWPAPGRTVAGMNAAWIGIAVLAAGLLLLALLHQDEALHLNDEEKRR